MLAPDAFFCDNKTKEGKRVRRYSRKEISVCRDVFSLWERISEAEGLK